MPSLTQFGFTVIFASSPRRVRLARSYTPCMKTFLIALLLAVSPFLLGGCITITGRILMNKSTFAAASPDEKRSIRKGVVQTGFTPDMVYLALGRPDKVEEVALRQGGTSVKWVYMECNWSEVSESYYGYSYSSGMPDRYFSAYPSPGAAA